MGILTEVYKWTSMYTVKISLKRSRFFNTHKKQVKQKNKHTLNIQMALDIDNSHPLINAILMVSSLMTFMTYILQVLTALGWEIATLLDIIL